MAEHVWSVLCDTMIVDEFTNKASIIGTVERIHIYSDSDQEKADLLDAYRRGEPVGIPVKVQLASYFVRSDPEIPEKIDIQPVIECPDGSSFVTPVSATVDLTNTNGFRIRGEFPALPFRGTGTYWFKIMLAKDMKAKQKKPLARIPVRIDFMPPDGLPG